MLIYGRVNCPYIPKSKGVVMLLTTRVRMALSASVLAVAMLACSGDSNDSRVDAGADTCDEAFGTTCNSATQAAFDAYKADRLSAFVGSSEFSLDRIEAHKL